MNNLDRDIESGEVVVIHESYFKAEYKALAWRIHVALGGFGLLSHTSGSFLGVTNLADGEEYGTNGLNISRKETEAFQAKYGKDGSGWKDMWWAKNNPEATPPEVPL